MKQPNSLKTIALSLGLAAGLLSPMTMNAQYDEHKFGLQPWGETSLLGRESSRGGDGGYNISVEQFGGENGGGQGGFNIGTEQFGDAPLGSGLFIMAAAGAAYAFSKKRKKQENN